MTPLEALWRCQRAWEQTQPQLFFELWPDDGLDEREACRPPLVEPARLTPRIASPAGGLEPRLTAGEAGSPAPPTCESAESDLRSASTSAPAVSLVLNPGAEPWHAHTGRPANARVSPPAWSGGSAPLINQTGPGASPHKVKRPAQEVTL